ncbi:hypothetical protein PIB30_004261 [Stylosanthes scabra]|uniref:RNase H type-1 domain-containing protein n=1 Tax=Stylosanthes scabra TaxID=79078 RepID=A0ABU6S413_9FABA|nr:hypothetical protein [Stylosanthes scabra]
MNNDVFSLNDPWSLDKIIVLCRHSSREFEYFSTASQSTLPNALRLDWIPPHANFVKVNCDGSFFVQGFLAGFGCIIRNSDGGLDLAWTAGYRNIVCGMDCLDALQLIQLEWSPSTVEYDLVCKTKNILSRN